MTRWEYRVVRPEAHKNDILFEINTAGKDGWELVGHIGGFIYLKRQLNHKEKSDV